MTADGGYVVWLWYGGRRLYFTRRPAPGRSAWHPDPARARTLSRAEARAVADANDARVRRVRRGRPG